MSVEAVNSVNGSNSNNETNSSLSVLSEDTIKKLEALGLDPTKYTSEEQAEEAIAAAQQPQQTPQTGSNSYDTIKTEVDDLASQMGIDIGNKDTLDDILDKISTQITTLQADAGTDQTKLQDANNYQNEYTTISNELSQLEAAQNMTGATALASYNKASIRA